MTCSANDDPSMHSPKVTRPTIHEVYGRAAKHRYQGAFTQPEADAILSDFRLPEGWRLIAAPMRSFTRPSPRTHWGIALWHEDTLEKGLAAYDVRGACFHLQAHAERESRGLVVTTDRDGYVTSIEDAPEDWDLEGQPEFNGAFR